MEFKSSPFCILCGNIVTDKMFVAVSSVLQTNRKHDGETWVENGAWIRRHSIFYHKDCFASVAGAEITESIVNPQIEEEDLKKMQRRAFEKAKK